MFCLFSFLFTGTELGQQVTAVTQLWQPTLIKRCQPGESCQAAGDQRRVWPMGKAEGMWICLWLRGLFSPSWLWRQAAQGHGQNLTSMPGRSLWAGRFSTAAVPGLRAGREDLDLHFQGRGGSPTLGLGQGSGWILELVPVY